MVEILRDMYRQRVPSGEALNSPVPVQEKLRWVVGGIWQNAEPFRVQTQCSYVGPDGQPHSGTNWNTQPCTKEPMPDGVFQGNLV